MKKSILVMTSSFPRWDNDTDSSFILDLSQHLADDFNIFVLCPHTALSKTHEKINQCHIVRFRYAPEFLELLAYDGGIQSNLKKNKLLYLVLPLFFSAQIFSTIKLLKKHQIDIIHAHWLIPQGLSALIARFFTSKKIKLVSTSHGGDLFSLKTGVNHWIKQQVLNQSAKLTVVSQAMKDFVLENFHTPHTSIDVISMGSDLRKTFVPNQKIQKKKNHLLFVGRLVEKKGIEHLLRAMACLVSAKPDIILQIIGSGPDKTTLVKLSESLGIINHVRFLGHLPHKQLIDYYHQATIAVFPFQIAQSGDQEGLGLVVIEAMGCGCPVIAGDVPAVHDTIINGKTGLLVSPDKTELFVKTINELLENEQMQSTLASEARKYVLEKYDWHCISERYKQLFMNINSDQ